MRKTLFFFIAVAIIITSATGFSNAAMVVPASATSTPSEPDPATVKAALGEFKSLSKKERKSRIKDAKKEVKAYKAAKKAGSEPSTNTLLLVILAILLPPLAVYLHQGEINTKFWISLLLTLLFWLPGVIYALIVILGDQ
ncbi:YqaE/Pmp3 family membrane protein [Terrimonas pollutisoli]|uniref:YqaE/Pmp3 family membrane protein n=1 Tax=Terrimonas pollutisoli TaxID=3034147 RepID=UPI0023EBB1CF|nr:YqaE/Pmp3 family membrane protein [Terrimonas sp. H1YJ31]